MKVQRKLELKDQESWGKMYFSKLKTPDLSQCVFRKLWCKKFDIF